MYTRSFLIIYEARSPRRRRAGRRQSYIIFCNISINRRMIMFLYSLLAFWCCYEVKHYIISQGLPSTYWIAVVCAPYAVLDFSFLAAGAAVVPTGWPFSSSRGQWQQRRLRKSQICGAHLSRLLLIFAAAHRHAKSLQTDEKLAIKSALVSRARALDADTPLRACVRRGWSTRRTLCFRLNMEWCVTFSGMRSFW